MNSPVGGNQVSPGTLTGLSVVECGEGVSAAFATRIMADLGAEVLKVEPPDGDWTRRRGPFPKDQADPEKSGLFIYLNANKLGVTLDLTRTDDRDTLAALLDGADILIHNVPVPARATYELESAKLRRRHPSLLIGAISPFGDHGPHHDWKAYELNVVNAGGWAFLSPGSSQMPELPPLKTFGHQGDFQAGLHACYATLATLWDRANRKTGEHIEVSAQECIAGMLELSFGHYAYAGREASRLGHRAVAPWTIMECSDGYIMMLCIEQPQWERLVELMGNPAWTKEEIFADGPSRGRNADALYALMNDWVKGWKTQELFHAAQARRIPIAPVSSMRDLYESEQLSDRNYFVKLNQPGLGPVPLPGAPFKSSAGGWGLRRPAPVLGQHNQSLPRPDHRRTPAPAAGEEQSGGSAARPASAPTGGRLPLSGVRVLDLTWVWAGPYCTLQLAHMGAEVIRLESASRLCPTRRVGPFADDIPGINRSSYFNQYNLGKRSVTINLSKPEGVSIALELAKHSDLVIDNFSAGAMERMGLGYETLRRHRPDIIMMSLSGYGQTGPWRSFLSYGPPAAAHAGLFFLTGYEGMGPSEVGVSFADPTAGIFGAIAAMAALFHRRRTGQGQRIDLSQLEATVTLAAEGLLEFAFNGREPVRAANHDAWMAPHNCYKAAGDENKWVSLAIGSEAEWRALCSVIGDSALAHDPRFCTMARRKQNEAALDEIITTWTRAHDRWAVTEALQREAVAAFPSMSSKDLVHDTHLRERGYLVEPEHPEVGRRIHGGVPWRMSETQCQVRSAAPLLGADTDSVLRDLLGYSGSKLAQLRAAQVLA